MHLTQSSLLTSLFLAARGISLKPLFAAAFAVAITACGPQAEGEDDVLGVEFQAVASAPALGTAIKYHPGHYYHIPNQNPQTIIDNNEFKNTPALRGAQLRYTWIQLEPTKDGYQFDKLRSDLDALEAAGERLIILLQTKSFGANDHVVPVYMRNASYDGGEFSYAANGDSTLTPKGRNLALWNDNVRTRLNKLINRLGTEFNAELYFEGIGIAETAIGVPVGAVPNFSESKFFSNLLAVNKAMKLSFPNTMTFQFLNYPPGVLENFIVGPNGLTSFAGGLGGPDVWMDDPGVNGTGRVYSYYDRVSHQIPLLPSIMFGNYRWSHHGGGFQPTLNQLLTKAREDLHANYLFWSRVSKVGDPGYYTDVLALLNKPEQKVNAAGGLDNTCPSAYPSCYRN